MDNNNRNIPVTLALPIQNPSSSSSKKPNILISPNFFKPPHHNTNTKKKEKKNKKSLTSSSSLMMRELERFGEVYERVEISKAKHEVEMEKQRIGFAKEIQLSRMDLFVKIQMQVSKLKNQ